jgi:hypothetical protein
MFVTLELSFGALILQWGLIDLLDVLLRGGQFSAAREESDGPFVL